MRVRRKTTCWRSLNTAPTGWSSKWSKTFGPTISSEGVIIQVVQEDAASGASEVHVPGGFRHFWTLTRFLSRSPIRDAWGVVETPTTSSIIPLEQTGVASPSPIPTPNSDAGASNQQDAAPTPK